MKMPATIKFLCKWIAHPKTTGAVCPSSRFLARKMARGAGNCKGGVVVELGAGTGAVTEYLVKAGLDRDSKLYCIEFDSALCQTLRGKFPTAIIVNDSAENIRKIVGAVDTPKIKAVVSSLPFLSLPKDMGARIIEEIEASLSEGGRFVQYTYNLNRDPLSIGFKSMKHVSTSRVYINIPPARVDVFEKSGK